MGGTNNKIRSVAPKSLFADAKNVAAGQSWNQGDLLIFNTSTKKIAKPAAESDASTFIGVATTTVVSGHDADVYATDVDASVGAMSVPGGEYGSEFKFVLKSGDALTPGASVYSDPVTGTRNVQAAGTKPIGIYEGASITGDGTKEVVCLIGARYPNDTLKF